METPEIGGYKSIRMEMEPGTYYWCSCGKSSNQPFCDGSHKGSSFSPMAVEITEKKQFHGVHASNQPINHFVMERINN